ncbi:glycosyltransferase family 4 protein [Ammoniphilus resinae]|uniref:Spore coat protein SA n=1 Tax=Ammoniphilus resinae TaxID=861532 RepID=A0ABS4GRT8_9BACL|nr:glycosyltransferase family 4 protein [Ammoniphilus resinae]MBP1932981.1 spore coat protein SA [Ammoniphilus resinae]
MKILMIAPDAFPVSSNTGGSVEISMYQIGKRVAENDHVTIVSRKAKGLPSKQKNGRFTIIRFTPGPNYLNKVIKTAKRKNWDIIQVDNRPRYIPLLRQHLPNSRLVLNLHSLTFMSRLSRQQQEQVVRMATAIICNSGFIRNQYQRMFPGYSKKFHKIYLGTDLSRFHPPSKQERRKELERFGLNSAFHILNVGRVIPGKGVHVLVKAAGIVRKKYPNIRLLVIGPLKKSAYAGNLLRQARKAKLDMKIIGPQKPSMIHRVYWLGEIFVCPTQMPEAFGLVNVEAMASGLPVIASGRGGVKEILSGSRGILVENYRSAKAFAKAIQKLIKSPRKAKKLGVKGRNFVKGRFSWNKSASEYRDFYKKIRKKR